MTEHPSDPRFSPRLAIHDLLPKVMASVGAVGKTQRNTEQDFMFRGIDQAMNAVHPALVEHGVHFVPRIVDATVEKYETKRGTAMKNVTVTVDYEFFAPDGSSVVVRTMGEAADVGDKAVGKAQSVALKFALLHALCIPTRDMTDPDADTHERATQAESGTGRRESGVPSCPGCGKPAEGAIKRHEGALWHRACIGAEKPAEPDAEANPERIPGGERF